MSTDDPRAAPDEVEPGIPATTEVTEDQWRSGTTDEGDPVPRDYPQGVQEWGTTAEEEKLGESLRMRSAREMPDVVESEPPYLNRPLYEPGAEEGIADTEPELVGDVDGAAGEPLSAEEAAMQIVDEPPGANYDPDPGYVDPDVDR